MTAAPAADAPVTRRCEDEAATEAHAAVLARALRRFVASQTERVRAGSQPAVAAGAFRVHLIGDLGAGKTTWARGALRAFGVSGAVRSPTYALLEPHSAPGLLCVHADLYRLSGPGDLDGLGFGDYDRPGIVWFVEWPDRAGGGLGDPDLSIALQRAGSGRVVSTWAHSAAGRDVLSVALLEGL